jgi:type III secretory pathway component EscV
MPVAVDTLNIYSRLKSTGLSEESAKEIAEVFRETIEENLATKNDLKTTENKLANDLKTTENNLIKYIESVRSELKKEIAESRAGTIKWVAGMLVAQAVLIATLAKLF